MKQGGFRSQNLLDDALTIATIESDVGVRAFDADRVDAAARDPPDAPRKRPSRGAPESCRSEPW